MPYKNIKHRREASKKHYRKNKARRKARNVIKSQEAREFINEYKESHSCVDCGMSNIIALDFDHVRGVKKYNVSSMVKAALSIKTIIEEIAKCEIRCSNCHRIVTHERKMNKKMKTSR